MNVAQVFKTNIYVKSTDHQDPWIIKFNRSKDLDATAPPLHNPLLLLLPLFHSSALFALFVCFGLKDGHF